MYNTQQLCTQNYTNLQSTTIHMCFLHYLDLVLKRKRRNKNSVVVMQSGNIMFTEFITNQSLSPSLSDTVKLPMSLLSCTSTYCKGILFKMDVLANDDIRSGNN